MATNETKTPAAVAASFIMNDDARQDALVLEFANGARMLVAVSDLAPGIVRHAVLHGLKQKLVDAAAISRNPDTGRSATAQDKYEAVREVFDRITDSENPAWNKRAGDGSGASTGGLLFRALCRLSPKKTPEQVRAFLDGASKEEQASMRKNPAVAAMIDRIRAESVKPDVAQAVGSALNAFLADGGDTDD